MQLPPSVQISLLLIVAFLIGIVMTWLYWRRKQNKAIDHALFDREREIEKLTSEIDLLEIDGVKVSPSEYVRSKKSVIFRKNEKINQLERELDQLQIDGERVSASYYVIKTQKELAHKDEELSDLKRNMGAVPLSEEGESDKAELDQLKAVLNSFTIDGEEVSPQEYIGSKRKEIEELKQEIEQYKTSLEEREQEISKLRQGSGNTDEIPMAGSIDAGVRLVHNGIEMDITEYQDFISKELQTKENFIQEFHNELDLLHMNEDNGKLLSPGDAFSQLKRKLAEKDAEIERLTSDFSLVLDQEDSEEQGSLTPVEAFQRLKQQLADKDSQLANLKEEVEKQAAELDSVKPLSMSPGEAFAAMQNGKTEDSIAESNDEIEALRKELAEKDAKIASFESVFAFIPQPEGDSEHEPVSPEFIFNQLKEEISQRDLEISHFNEELAELDITTPETENRLGLPEALRLIKSEILNKNAEIEELKANTSNSENTDSENEESRTEELASLKTKMEELVSKLEKKDEELGSFTEIFSFLPKSDDPEVEAPNPKVIFDELQRKIDDHKLEINHFNEELAALDIETPETEERVGLPEALRLIKIELQDKDTEINDLKSQLEEVKNQPYEPNEELEAVDMKAFRELEEKLNDKENEIEDLKMKLESQPESGGTETTGDEQEGELAKLRLALEQKDEELAKFTAAFDFLPKTEDPEVEDPGPKFVFEQLQKQLEERDIEISHFNEELDKLDFDTPETESRIGLPEALRLVQTQLSDKDQLIEELRQEIDGLKASGPSTTPSAPEEVAGEPILNDSDTDWSSISREYTIENIQASAEKNTNMEAEGALLKEGFSELGIEFNRSMKEFLPASVYETLQSLENEGISVSDHKGYFLVFNESLEEMLGYNRAEANDESEISFLERLYPDPNYRAVVGANIAKIPEDGTFDTNMAYVTSKDGQIKHLKVASTSFYFSRNKYYLSYYTPED